MRKVNMYKGDVCLSNNSFYIPPTIHSFIHPLSNISIFFVSVSPARARGVLLWLFNERRGGVDSAQYRRSARELVQWDTRLAPAILSPDVW